MHYLAVSGLFPLSENDYRRIDCPAKVKITYWYEG